MKIAFLGPEGSYSNLAAKEFLKIESKMNSKVNDWDECVPFRNFSEVLSAVSLERVDAAAVPIENSLQGGVLQNMDLLQASSDLYAVKELVLRIDHRLVYKQGMEFSQIGRVYSHGQALNQCSVFLGKEIFLIVNPNKNFNYLFKYLNDNTLEINISIDGDFVNMNSLFLSYVPSLKKSYKTLFSLDAHINFAIGSPILFA